jgi:hypothetical protein
MEHRVGDPLPSEGDVDKLVNDVGTIRTKTEKFCVALTTEERKKAVKFREGGDAIVALVGKLLDEHGVTLPDVTRDGMTADVQLARRIEPLRASIASLLQLLDDTILEAQSEAWWAATAGYTALARMSKGNARLEADLRPAVEFFRLGKRTPKPTP